METSDCGNSGLICCHTDALSGMEPFYQAPVPVADVCETPFPGNPFLPYWTIINAIDELTDQGCRVSSVSETLEAASDLRVSSVDAELAAWTGSGVSFAHPGWREPSSVVQRSDVHVDLPMARQATMSARVETPADLVDGVVETPIVDPVLERKLDAARAGAMQAMADSAWLEEALDAAEIELDDEADGAAAGERKRCHAHRIQFKAGDYWGNTGSMATGKEGVYAARAREADAYLRASQRQAAEAKALREALAKQLTTSVDAKNAAATQRLVTSMSRSQLIYNRKYSLALVQRMREVDRLMLQTHKLGGATQLYLQKLEVCLSTGSAAGVGGVKGKSARMLRLPANERARRSCQSRLAALIRKAQKGSWTQAALREADAFARRVAAVATPKCAGKKRAGSTLCTLAAQLTATRAMMAANAAASTELRTGLRATVGKVAGQVAGRVAGVLAVPVVGWIIGVLDVTYLVYSSVIDWPYMACDLNSDWDCSPVFTVGNTMTLVWDELHNSIVLANEPRLLSTVAHEQASVWLCPAEVSKSATPDVLAARCLDSGYDSTLLAASPLADNITVEERRTRGRGTHDITLTDTEGVPLVPTLSYKFVLHAGDEVGVSVPFVVGTVGCAVDAGAQETGVCASRAACENVMEGTWSAGGDIPCHSAAVPSGRAGLGCCVGAAARYTAVIARSGDDEGSSSSPLLLAVSITAALCCLAALFITLAFVFALTRRRRRSASLSLPTGKAGADSSSLVRRSRAASSSSVRRNGGSHRHLTRNSLSLH